MNLTMLPPVALCYLCITELHLQRKRKKEGRPCSGRPCLSAAVRTSQPDCEGVLGHVFLGLVMDDRGLVEDLEDLRERRLLVGLFHRAELARQARRSGFEDLPL